MFSPVRTNCFGALRRRVCLPSFFLFIVTFVVFDNCPQLTTHTQRNTCRSSKGIVYHNNRAKASPL